MRLLALLAAGLFAGTLMAEDKKTEQVDNPQYATWAKFKSGTSVTFKVTTEFGGQKFESTVTDTLAEVNDDNLVVESVTATTSGGRETKAPAQKRDVPKRMEGGGKGADKPPGTVEEGKEKVKVGGTEYECRWFKTKNKVKLPTGEEGEVEGTLWYCDDVPGMVVKMKSKTKTGGVAMVATEVSLKK